MKKVAYIIFLILFCVWGLSAQVKLEPREYAVYATILKDIYKHNRETYSNKSEFVIINKTKLDPELELPLGKSYRNLVDDFSRRNKTSGAIERKFPRGSYSETYYLVSQNEINELEEQGRLEYKKRFAIEKLNKSVINPGGSSYVPFYQKYPEASGHYHLSRVGFVGKFAIVNVGGDHGWNGFSRIYILKKMKGQWTIISSSGSEWIS